MAKADDCRHLGSQCECHPRCIDIATGVLMEWGGLTPDEARGSLLRTALRKNVTVHAWALDVIADAVKGRA